jgi:hypothetical protein
MARAAGSIQSSLFEAGQADGVPIEVMSEIIHAFSYDVDFQREIQPGDRYEVLYERYADGDGVIQQIGPFSGYGNYIRVKHTSQYATAYGHISRFAGSLHVGSRVRQGQVIAYVGMTGRATGPHLHYEVLVNGKQINPQSIKLPTGEKLQGKELKTYLTLVANIDKQRRDLAQSGVVASVR